MTTLDCSGCGLHVGMVRDNRFGLDPRGILCLRCSHPAYRV